MVEGGDDAESRKTDPTLLTNDLVSRATSALREVIEARLDQNDKAVVRLETESERRIDDTRQAFDRLLDERLRGLHAALAAHVDAVRDRDTLHAQRIDRIQLTIDRRPAEVAEALQHLRDLLRAEATRLEEVADQRFLRIDAGLLERDKRADQLALANSAALAAALAAQKEAAGEAQKSAALAISKSETATSESIKQGQTLFQTGLLSLTNQVNDIKSRLDKGEGSRTISDPATETRLAALTATVTTLSGASDRGTGANQQRSDMAGWIVGAIGAAAAVALVVVDMFVLRKP